METNQTIASRAAGPDSRIAGLPDRLDDSASIIDTLMALPADEEDEGSSIWKRMAERRLAKALRERLSAFDEAAPQG